MSSVVILRGAPGTGKSTVSKLVSDELGWPVVEVDEVKIARYGTASQCKPAEDFPEAGIRARAKLEGGSGGVIIVEYFADRQHVLWSLDAAGFDERSPDVIYFWLNCDLGIASARKAANLSESEVAAQHARLASRYCAPREVEIDTANIKAAQVASEIIGHIKQRWPTYQ